MLLEPSPTHTLGSNQIPKIKHNQIPKIKHNQIVSLKLLNIFIISYTKVIVGTCQLINSIALLIKGDSLRKKIHFKGKKS